MLTVLELCVEYTFPCFCMYSVWSISVVFVRYVQLYVPWEELRAGSMWLRRCVRPGEQWTHSSSGTCPAFPYCFHIASQNACNLFFDFLLLFFFFFLIFLHLHLQVMLSQGMHSLATQLFSALTPTHLFLLHFQYKPVAQAEVAEHSNF